MIALGLTSSERRDYINALPDTRPLYVSAYLLDRNEDFRGSLNGMVLDGAVAIDADADVTRSIEIDLLDPKHRLQLSLNSPRRSAVAPGMFLRVIRHDYVAALDDYVDCPVFWGPITRFERDGAVARVEAVGKESLNLEPRVMWEGFTIRKGTKVVKAIEKVLRKAGERRFNLPDYGTRRLPKDLSVTRHDEGWRVAKRLARSINRQIFYDGRGKVTLRRIPSHPVFKFYALKRPGYPDPVVLSEPKLTYDFFSDMRNTIEVLGQEPSGDQRRPRYVATPSSRHRLSPSSLSFNGEPGYIVETVENDKIRRTSQAEDLAKSLLKRRLKIGTQLDFESLPVPCLEEMDLARLILADTALNFRMRQFTIPLGLETMSVGSLKRSKLQRAS